MITFGLAIGLAFPYAVDPFVTWNPDRKPFFRIACLVAGFAVGAFCYFLVKITLYQRNVMLMRAKAEWEISFDALSEGVIVADTKGIVLRANRSFASMFGCTVGEILGKPVTELTKKLRQENECLIQLAMETGRRQAGEITTGGNIFEQSANPVFDVEGKIIGCVGVLRDVTADRHLRQKLIQSAKMAAVGRLVSGVAHELNNPLTGIIALAELLLKKEQDDNTRRDLKTILNEGQRAADIVARLLSFVRENSDNPKKLKNVNNIITEALDLKKYDLQKNEIVVETSLAASDFPVVAEGGHLRQVFLNLINNAEDAMRNNGSGGKLRVYTEKRENRLRIHFADNGPGIPPENRDQIFDPFFTTKGIGQGTGLGLSICYGIIEEHGGRIWLEDDHAPGAHFVIELPMAAEAA
jgi:two-component system NtrC family sensor kinase